MRKFLKSVLVFLATWFVSCALLVLIFTTPEGELSDLASMVCTIVPLVLAVLAVWNINRDHSQAEYEPELSDVDDSSYRTVIKEELSCLNWQLVSGVALLAVGVGFLLTMSVKAVVLIPVGAALLIIGISKYRAKVEKQELEQKRRAKASEPQPMPQKEPQPQQPTRPAESAKEQTYRVAGVTNYVDNIMRLSSENEDYSLSKRELVEDGQIEEKIWKYEFYPRKVELVPEPDNQYDPDAVKVIVDGEPVGYIKRGSCKHVLNLLANDGIASITCQIGGGPYKYISEDYDDDLDKEVYTMDREETNFFVHLKITEKKNVSDCDTTPEPPQPESSDEEKKTYCVRCGREVPRNAVYCPACGNRTEVDPWSQISSTGSAPIPGHQHKSKWVAFLLCLFLGIFGAHRFYSGKIGTAILYLFTGGLLGFGVLVDLILILSGNFKDGDGQPLK